MTLGSCARLLLSAMLARLAACGGGGSSAPEVDVAVTIPAPPTPTPAPVAGALSGRTLVWSDEFDIDGLPDPTRWDYDTDRNRLGWYNNELQFYARERPENGGSLGGAVNDASFPNTMEVDHVRVYQR